MTPYGDKLICATKDLSGKVICMFAFGFFKWHVFFLAFYAWRIQHLCIYMCVYVWICAVAHECLWLLTF